jgi:hypothetical protein
MKLNSLSNSQILSAVKASEEIDYELPEEDEFCSFEFNEEGSNGAQIAIYDNGGGDDLVVIFKNNSILIKGFDHESRVSPYSRDEYGVWPGMYDGAPKYLLDALGDESIEKDHVTFCYWRESETGEWQQGPVTFTDGENDGSDWLISSITDLTDYYQK